MVNFLMMLIKSCVLSVWEFIMQSRRFRRLRAFTLIELLTVMAIIAILLRFSFPALYRSREQANTLACQNNIRRLLLGFAGYLQNNNDHYPLSAVEPEYEDWIYWQAGKDPNREHYPLHQQ